MSPLRSLGTAVVFFLGGLLMIWSAIHAHHVGVIRHKHATQPSLKGSAEFDLAFFGRGMMGVVLVALSVHFAAVYLRTRRLPPDRENP